MSSAMIKDIESLAETSVHLDGQAFKALSTNHVQTLAGRYNIAGRDIEIAALNAGIIPQRYSRNMKTLSPREQALLLASSATVVGLGGLGGNVLELMARLGVGTFYVIDGDTFEESNLNRQLLCTQDTLGINKAWAAAKRIEVINPSVVVHPYSEYLREGNSAAIIEKSSVVVDCLDNVKDRFVLERAAKKAGRPLVSAAVAGLTGHAMTVFPEDPGLKLIYGSPEDLAGAGAQTILGCPPQAVALLAACQCSEVVHVLLNKKGLLRNRMLAVDLEDNTFEVVTLL
ncbi:MAG: ThiF family adenylyltransferase [Deltaproteobacteria bacterium]|nr:ThiF family adenylyltransferase [Deltaproteobacteria bacterium]